MTALSSAKRPKISNSLLGAPSQHSQTGRKGKRAWRKNVDIQDVELGLENLREEERATGTILQKKQDQELFHVDLTGDDQIRKSVPRLRTSQLNSTKILLQRSAVPAVFSRSGSTMKRKHPNALSREEKSRLLRIGKKLRRGPLNSVMDPTEFGSGSALLELSEAVESSGNYDPWSASAGKEEKGNDFKPVQEKVKAPSHTHPRDVIEVPAITEPHQGLSYNPPATAHQELLLKAHEVEERRLKETMKLGAVKEKINQGWTNEAENARIDVAPGMLVDPVDEETEEEETEEREFRTQNRLPKRKTRQQRNKAARLLAEKHALAERIAKRRFLKTLESAKTLRRAADRLIAAREQSLVNRQLTLREKARRGLTRQKIGKHTVPEAEIDVQLGEDLSESLRGLKPEGNLFRDRFLSLQQRGLLEPRVPVVPKKRSIRMKEYEKHAWKRFQ